MSTRDSFSVSRLINEQRKTDSRHQQLCNNAYDTANAIVCCKSVAPVQAISVVYVFDGDLRSLLGKQKFAAAALGLEPSFAVFFSTD